MSTLLRSNVRFASRPVSLYAVLVDRAMCKPNHFDGSTSARAIPAPHDKTLLEIGGISKESSGQEFGDCIEAYLAGRFKYEDFIAARAGIGRIGSVPYSWKTW